MQRNDAIEDPQLPGSKRHNNIWKSLKNGENVVCYLSEVSFGQATSWRLFTWSPKYVELRVHDKSNPQHYLEKSVTRNHGSGREVHTLMFYYVSSYAVHGWRPIGYGVSG